MISNISFASLDLAGLMQVGNEFCLHICIECSASMHDYNILLCCAVVFCFDVGIKGKYLVKYLASEVIFAVSFWVSKPWRFRLSLLKWIDIEEPIC